jgi:hypothetical protein
MTAFDSPQKKLPGTFRLARRPEMSSFVAFGSTILGA